ncbi:MAG: 1-deoxy-D-xylulose-5-phosphate reductoisomerase [Desulfobacterales bacterium]|nr:1-deoxy-D-xylulose-5-phosphate reductoisomerase [Desulfobacterales bacterium]
MKKLSILGSTGSIGRNTLEIVAMFPDRFTATALAAKSNMALLAEQIQRFRPEVAAVFDAERARDLKRRLPSHLPVEIVYGEEGYKAAAAHPSIHTVVTAVVGAAGLGPTLAAIDAGKRIALANKETLVMAGDIVMKRASEKGVSILPVDSEHGAIFQCLQGHREKDLDKILLTASGGPFRTTPADQFDHIRPEDALRHPTWRMGKKISIDSATLMNKGLEVIEAHHLFHVSSERIEVVVHPQSIVHSMVAYRDGSVIAQLGAPDMKGAIAYALSYPGRVPLGLPVPDFGALGSLTFEAPDFQRFPCLQLAFDACDAGGTLPAVLNAANEIAVAGFLDGRIPFKGIPALIRTVMERHPVVSNPSLDDIVQADRWAREKAGEGIGK